MRRYKPWRNLTMAVIRRLKFVYDEVSQLLPLKWAGGQKVTMPEVKNKVIHWRQRIKCSG